MTRDEFEQRIDQSRSKLLAIAHSMLPRDEWEDAIQSASLAAWEHLSQLRNEEAFDAWIKQILINECRAYHRKRSKEARVADALASITSEPPEEIGLRQAIEQLSESEKDLLLLHHEQGYTLSELSDKLDESESALKMRLYRARKRLRIALISLLLILLLLAAAAIGAGYLDVNWFLSNRRASNPLPYTADSKPFFDISYDGRLLSAEISDAVWDTEKHSLSITYSLTGTEENILTIHSGNIGVDGERFDHIWIDGQVLPVENLANVKPVHIYSLNGWTLNGQRLNASEDFLPDGNGESFFSEFHLNSLKVGQCNVPFDADGCITLNCSVFVTDYAEGNILEKGLLTARIAAPDKKIRSDNYEKDSD